MALRPRLSTGLLLSDIDWLHYIYKANIFAFHFSKIRLQECNANLGVIPLLGLRSQTDAPSLRFHLL